jgi:hypothetical protein
VSGRNGGGVRNRFNHCWYCLSCALKFQAEARSDIATAIAEIDAAKDATAAQLTLHTAHTENIKFLRARGWSEHALSDRAFLNVQRMRDGAARCPRCDNPTTDATKLCEICMLFLGTIPGMEARS